MVQCYKCGAYPNHPNKTLDTLKLIQCLDCDTIACMRHRDGIVGGKCAVCGSSRSTIAAFRKGDMEKNEGIGTVGSPAGANTVNSESTKLSSQILKDMQQTRVQAIQEIERKKQDAINAVAQAEATRNAIFVDDTGPAADPINIINYQTKNKQEEDSEILKQILGDKKLIMDQCANDSIGKVKESVPVTSSLISTVASAQFSERKIMGTTTNIEYDQDNLDFSFAEEQDNQTYNIKVRNNFYPIEEQSFDMDHMIEQQNEIKIEILELLSDIFKIEPEHICLDMDSNLFIPLHLIDKFMILEDSFYKQNDINIITGIRASHLTPDLVEYLNLFKEFMRNKSFIKGIFGEFGESFYYNAEEQKDIMISLLDMSFEHQKTFYIGANKDNIDNWIEIFNEYDLSKLDFVFTSLVTDEKTANFIKENNMKLLVTENADIEFYKNHFSGYLNNIIIGSGDDLFGLLKVINGMHHIDKNFKEKLIKK